MLDYVSHISAFLTHTTWLYEAAEDPVPLCESNHEVRRHASIQLHEAFRGVWRMPGETTHGAREVNWSVVSSRRIPLRHGVVASSPGRQARGRKASGSPRMCKALFRLCGEDHALNPRSLGTRAFSGCSLAIRHAGRL